MKESEEKKIKINAINPSLHANIKFPNCLSCIYMLFLKALSETHCLTDVMVERKKEGKNAKIQFNQIQQEVKINHAHSQIWDRAYYPQNTSNTKGAQIIYHTNMSVKAE